MILPKHLLFHYNSKNHLNLNVPLVYVLKFVFQNQVHLFAILGFFITLNGQNLKFRFSIFKSLYSKCYYFYLFNKTVKHWIKTLKIFI